MGDKMNLTNLFICLLFEANIQTIFELTKYKQKKEGQLRPPYYKQNTNYYDTIDV